MIAACAACGEARKIHARGWCNRCYLRWKDHGDPLYVPPVRMDYFDAHVDDVTDDCIVWPFGLNEWGYGYVDVIGGQRYYVHVLACERKHGPRPVGQLATHGPCHNNACFNWRHLSWDTPIKNSQDKLRDGTAIMGERHGQTVLTDAIVREIRARYASGGVTHRELAAEYGTSSTSIYRALKSWRFQSEL